MDFLGIIPARYHSSRLEGKPLLDIAGKPMIQHVYERAIKYIKNLYVATDDSRIMAIAQQIGARAVMTSKDHPNGTSRCLEAVDIINSKRKNRFEKIISIQGDEPLLEPLQLGQLMNCFKDDIQMATLVMKVKNYQELTNESECFVVINKRNEALYFSRSIIPYVRDFPKEKWLDHHTFYKHIGLYGYTYKALKEFSQMPISALEKAESLEQNRWIEMGNSIKVGYTDFETIPVDTPDDLKYVRSLFENKKHND